MTRTRTLFAILAPALVAGGIVAVSATSTRADESDDAREARREAREAAREAREAQKAAAKEAKAAMKEAKKQAREGIANALEQIEQAPIPEKLREKIAERLQRAAERIDERLDRAGSGDFHDMDAFEAEMEAMGEEIEAEMEAMGEEFENFGAGWDEWAKQFEKQWDGKAVVIDPDGNGFDFDFDPGVMVLPVPPSAPVPPVPPSPPSPPSVDIDLSDLDLTIDIDDLSLGADQIEQLHLIFEAEEDVLEPSREKLADLSDDLRDALEDPDASEAEIGRMVDAISAEEATIRKAQILAWVKSRKVLDPDQRDRVQKAKVKVKRGPRRVR
jgi:hypothetical protein